MSYAQFEQKLNNLEKIVGPVIATFNSPIMVERMCDSVDFMLFDGEHGIFNNENLIYSLQVCRLKGVPSFVRVADTEYHLISRALYMGADGIMIPRCETLEQIEKAVRSMNFPEKGKMGCGGHGQYRKDETIENYKRFLFLQIETPLGIENLPQMLEKYGEEISAIIIGPYDLSVILQKPFDFENPEHVEAVQKVFDICKKYNKSSGIFCDNEVIAERYYKMGANVLWTATDINMFMRGFNESYKKLEEL